MPPEEHVPACVTIDEDLVHQLIGAYYGGDEDGLQEAMEKLADVAEAQDVLVWTDKDGRPARSRPKEWE